ncbi:SDR family NAD(P)-dependent oxidoreductase [Sporosarcina oncorhynchi]|uniref:SDR family NAD(P)-dependent oxidoreductase n=1 Tax=Sporosarcina oncorhynchi TaxID=3056444 RepID=A0ABZ0L8Q6_9BACL|nr:SDR family NAD(P)-dependent oxidoreductase [Sporosarcina sp. T2O-4]WOV88921.1 SDR family NAD(P)-dependent oxidoreductase [Sporosarcina sp. T2O-4]
MSSNKKVLITGATSGVGYAVAMRLLADTDRFTVYATGRAPDKIWQLQNEGAVAVRSDFSVPGQMDKLLEEMPPPDIVIFSAGVGLFESAHKISDESIQNMIDLNVVVPMELTKRVLPTMIERQQGQLIYIGSQAGKVATPKASVYAASKHALIGYTNALRMEVAEYGINVSVVHPGPIDTPFIDEADQTGNYRKSLGRHLLKVDTVADAVLRMIDKPAREVNVPGIMGVTSKLYALAPTLIEKLGKKYFMKK